MRKSRKIRLEKLRKMMLANLSKPTKYKHPFHIVSNSPWPFVGAFSAFVTAVGFVMYCHNIVDGLVTFKTGLYSLIGLMFAWWRDVIREGTFEGKHTSYVQNGLRFGMILFIVSEVMFFFSFFWAFFSSALNPVYNIGGVWPPTGIEVISPWMLPLLNTALLICSGVTVTLSHYSLLGAYKKLWAKSLLLTVSFGLLFTYYQYWEYSEAKFSISDGIYGSVFYMLTGFHGFHVIVGVIFLIICGLRLYFLNDQSRQHHVGFEAAIWYWHFVDVVWIFLYLFLYWWGGKN